jgi:hypothetical protein
MILLPTFEDRFKYLKLGGKVGGETFGWDRYFNQMFYKSTEWLHARQEAILRDNGCDLAIEDREIMGKIIVHHMNPLTLDQIESGGPELFDLRYLVCVSHETHNAIHYGDEHLLIPTNFVERKPNDTCPWLQ